LSLYSSSYDPQTGLWSAAQLFTTGDNFEGTNAQAAVIQPAALAQFDVSSLLGAPPASCCNSNPPPPPKPPETNCLTCDTNNTTPVSSEDPNGKIGPAGYGPANWVLGDTAFSYTIEFENATNATVPAQIVTISDPLSTNLNWTTFALAEIGFGSVNLPIPPNSQ
jgi:hypothetical protein